MRSVNKLFFLFVICTAALTLLTACGKPELADENWHVDLNTHWHQAVNGETIDEGAHKLEEDRCTVCNTRFDYFDDGETWLSQYNDHEDMIRWTIYNSDGEIIDDTIYEYVYDKNGEYVSEKQYDNSILSIETFFTTIPGDEYGDDFTYAHESILYLDDGGKIVENYDTEGETIAEKTYDAEGNLISDYTVKYTYSENGFMLSMEKFSGDVLAESIICEYDENYVQTGEKYYEGEKLVKEHVYTVVDGWSYVSSIIEYHEDGTQTVTEYDENDNIVG